MERFSYPSLAALYAESAELLRLLDAEHHGKGMDEEEEHEEQLAELDRQRSEYGR